jgi:hypothetical protein
VIAVHLFMEEQQKKKGEKYSSVYDKIPKNRRRFDYKTWKFVHANFECANYNELVILFNETAVKLVFPGDLLAGDEGTWSHDVGKEVALRCEMEGWAIPKNYVPRKPHENCFWVDLLMTKLSKGKHYTLFFCPFYEQPGNTPFETIRFMCEHLKKSYPNHRFVLTLDSLYDSQDVIDYLKSQSNYIRFVISCTESRHEGVFDLLREHTKLKEWNGLSGQDDILFSLFVQFVPKTGEKRVHRVISNFFKTIDVRHYR